MKRLLVFEDDILTQGVLRRLFKEEFEIDFCESGEQYSEKYKNNNYDIIIIDISLKGTKSGIDLISEIKSFPDKMHIPILCLTAHAFAKDRNSALNSGADLFLTKPVDNEIIKSSVLSLVNKNVLNH